MSNSTLYQPPAHGFRTFLIVWLTQSLSAFGSHLTFFTIVVWLTQVLYPRPEQKPELAFAIAALGICFGVPAIFGAPIAGAWADRHDRKRTMLAVDVLHGILVLVLLGLMVGGNLQLWMLLVLSVFASFLSSFHWSSFSTSYSMLVPKEQLPRANGMMTTTEALSGILAPTVAALLLALPALARQGAISGALGAALATLRDGAALTLIIDALTFFIAGATLLFLFIPSPQRADLQAGKPRISIWADVREGAVYIWRRRPMLWLLGTFAFSNFVHAPLSVFQTLLVKFSLAFDWSARGFTFETALAFISTMLAAGGVVGGFFVSAWGGLKSRRVYGVIVPMIVAGIAQIVFGLSPYLFLSAAMLFLFSVGMPIVNAHSQAIWQAQTPHELQGRVFAVRRLIAQFTFPFGTALGGWMAGVFDVGWVTAVLGAFLVVFCIPQLFNPYLLRVEDHEWLEKLAARAAAKPTTGDS